ncbi:GNAT family N-acetyltransferase [Micromonospora sp. KC721]|uniref:GNAT family N-acetyltransferase n=1 Tax=Micromonospora sp. KC721 TaxID=2530380 RepID=UPI001045897A|nr:GNAT family N-acetyltransferase [Micromonospora sp. KC721]TDB80560.1 N-acetyltransferase [Micromonospora sp. KC721]
MSGMIVRRAVEGDLEALVLAYTAATADEASRAWITMAGPVPEETQLAFLTESVRRHLTNDEVLVADRDGRIEGFSVWRWIDSRERLHAEAEELAAMAEATGLAVLGRAETARRATIAAQPGRFPYLYLYLIAVMPQSRGSGTGGAMLRQGLREADTAGLATYLEASTEDSARLYKRCGFEEFGTRLQLPDDGPELIPMYRVPVRS